MLNPKLDAKEKKRYKMLVKSLRPGLAIKKRRKKKKESRQV